MSGCDGSGRLIGCPGCGVCEEEMEAIDAAKRQAYDALAALRHRTTQRDSDPWADTQGEK